MADRKPIPDEIQTLVLTRSARRCALCFGLDGDLTEQRGQIAHLDHDPSNNVEDNLAYLCLDHHDLYDSRTSQSKGLKEAEVKTYRERLYRAVETGLSRVAALEREAEAVRAAEHQRAGVTIEHDVSIFQRADEILPEQLLDALLTRLQSDDSLLGSDIRQLVELREFFRIRGNHYLHKDLGDAIVPFLRSVDELRAFTGRHFFVYPRHLLGDEQQYCLHPGLNVDREGSGELEEAQRYDDLQHKLDERSEAVRTAYRAYRLAIKVTLFR